MGWYYVLCALVAVYVAWDASTRRFEGRVAGWAWVVFLTGLLALPFYLARRPLKAGEVRVGGVGWNACRYFALLWTLWTALVLGLAAVGPRSLTVYGAGGGLALWAALAGGALLVGRVLRKPSVVERGPTGLLADPPVEPDA